MRFGSGFGEGDELGSDPIKNYMKKLGKEMKEEEFGGYLFSDGKLIDFEEIMFNQINFRRETGALRIRLTSKEINIDFLEEKRPTKKQLKKIEDLKLINKKLVFEIVDKNNQSIKQGGFDKTIPEMMQQLNKFYSKG